MSANVITIGLRTPPVPQESEFTISVEGLYVRVSLTGSSRFGFCANVWDSPSGGSILASTTTPQTAGYIGIPGTPGTYYVELYYVWKDSFRTLNGAGSNRIAVTTTDITGITRVTPTFISDGQVFEVPFYKQVLFSEPIVIGVGGSMVLSGSLIDARAPRSWTGANISEMPTIACDTLFSGVAQPLAGTLDVAQTAFNDPLRPPVDLATTTNITLSGSQVVDGFSTDSTMRILVKNQTDTTQNGIYRARTGAWDREHNLSGAPYTGAPATHMTQVLGGNANAGKFFITDATTRALGTITWGSSNVTYAQWSPVSAKASASTGAYEIQYSSLTGGLLQQDSGFMVGPPGYERTLALAASGNAYLDITGTGAGLSLSATGSISTGISSNKKLTIFAAGGIDINTIPLTPGGAATNTTLVAGSLLINSVGQGLRIKEGTNAKQGLATLVAGSVTVSNTSVTGYSRIALTSQDDNGGTPGFLRITSIVPGFSFTVTSSNAADTSIVFYQITEAL